MSTWDHVKEQLLAALLLSEKVCNAFTLSLIEASFVNAYISMFYGARFIHFFLTETWTDKGCEMDVTLVPGDYDACLKELERLTKGNYVFDVSQNYPVTLQIENLSSSNRLLISYSPLLSFVQVANSHVEEPLATQGARKQGGKKKGGGGKGKKGK
tara:strand:- start:274 stop:741 length:468 start_codon:yes stop_codon:yes gene_type:complete